MSSPPASRLGAIARSVILALSAAGALTLLAAGALAGPALAASPRTALSHTPRPRTTLPHVEAQVMCVTCKIPLEVAESPQAERERAYIQSLIDEGLTETQIKRALIAQYGSTVLALPAAHGFDLAAYLVPLAVVLALLGALVVLLPRWRRQARAQAARPLEAPPAISPSDAARLQADLVRHDR
jgi:cytochrome c-type biogenesis protein CcmH